MASANVNFDNIPASIRKPGKYLEFNTKLAVRTLATNPQTVLIIAQKTADGTAAEKTPVQVFDTDTAGKLFGVGSQAARMVRAAMRAYGYVDLSVLPVADDSAGVSSSAFSVSSSVARRISKSRWNALLFSSHSPIANCPLIVSMRYSSFLSCANILMSRLASFSVSYCSPTSVTTHPV